MKKISICALALFTTLAMQAQNKKGNWLLGASLGKLFGYSFGKSESGTVGSTNISYSDNNSFNLGIYPTVGYYISDNVIPALILLWGSAIPKMITVITAVTLQKVKAIMAISVLAHLAVFTLETMVERDSLLRK